MELELEHSYLVTNTYLGSNGLGTTKDNDVHEIYVEAIRERHYQIRELNGIMQWVLKEDFHRQYNIEDKLGKGPYTDTITTN